MDGFLISGGKVRVSVTTPLGGKEATVPLPEIHFTDLGQGPEGITAAELSRKVLRAVLENATKAAASVVAELSTKGATALSNELRTNAVEKVTKNLGDLLKKKP